MNNQSYDLNIYLLPNCTNFTQAFSSRARDTAPLHLVEPTDVLAFEARLYCPPPTHRIPPWMDLTDGVFTPPHGKIPNQSTQAMVLLRVADHLFAISFGSAWTTLDRDHIEPDFGKYVALNVIDDAGLSTVDTRSIESVPLQRRTHRGIGGRVRDLRLDLDQDWVRSVVGASSDTRVPGKVEGADAVKLKWPGRFDELGALCEQLLAIFQEQRHREKFPELDGLRPIARGAAERAELTARLQRRFTPAFVPDGVLLDYPGLPDRRLSRIAFAVGHHEPVPYDDLSVDRLAAFLSCHRGVDPAKVAVLQLDPQGEVIHRDRLTSYLSLEERIGDNLFLFAQGEWFRVPVDYLRRIEEQVCQIPDLTAVLGLRDWQEDELTEAVYNMELAQDRGWLHLDRANQHYKKRQQIEPCDLLAPASTLAGPVQGITPGPLFLAVKDRKGRSSAPGLSHLFAQGLVSFEMMRGEHQLRDRITSEYQRRYGGTFALDGAIVVFAIADVRPFDPADANPAAGTLTLFSMVNLLKQAKEIRRMGGQVALCRIRRHENATARAAAGQQAGQASQPSANTIPASKAA